MKYPSIPTLSYRGRFVKDTVRLPILSPALHAARALAIAEQYLQDWQDDPLSPRADVDKMLFAVSDPMS